MDGKWMEKSKRFERLQWENEMSQQTMEQIRKSLAEHNFSEYSSSHPIHRPGASSRWSRRVYDENGKIKYFIQAYLYERIRPHLPDGVEFEATMYQEGQDKEWFTVELCSSTVERAFEFFDQVYGSMGCVLDRHNN